MFVGLDLGTSRYRAIAFDSDGCRVSSADARAEIRYGADGSATIDPVAAWQAASGLLGSVARAGPVRAVSVTAQLAILGVSKSGRPTTPALLWSDRRARTEADAIAACLGDHAYPLTGRPILPEAPAAKILWFASHRPNVSARTSSWLSLKDYIVARLTGEICTDPTHASYTCLFDVGRLRWSARLAEAANVDVATLPRVADAASLAGTVSIGAAAVTRLPVGTPVAVGAPDGTAGAVGAGAVRAGITVDVAGSTDVLFRTTRKALLENDRRLVVNAFAVPGLWAVGGPTGLSGGAIAWLARLLGYTDAAALRQGIAASVAGMPEGSEGVVFRTELTGGRFPDWRPDALGVISGLRPEHRAGHLIRAAEEGSAFLVATGLDAIAEHTSPVRQVVVVGGTSRHREALELRASAWRRIVTTVREADASALGAAMFAAVAAGEQPSLVDAASAMVHPAATYRPVRRRASVLSRSRLAWESAVGGPIPR